MITGHTKVVGLFGHPVDHTLSPAMQNAAFQAAGLSYCYLPFDVHPSVLKEAVRSIFPLGMKGVNLTIPHKQTVIPFLDRLSHDAERIGAVNTIERSGTLLVGHNTDGIGFLKSLHEQQVDPGGLRVILVGAGGAALGVALTLAQQNITEMILIVRTTEGRTIGGTTQLAARLTAWFPMLRLSLLEMTDRIGLPHLPHFKTLLINATPLGMREGDPFPFPPSLMETGWIVADLVYRPFETPLLREAAKRGIKTISGMGMLLHQGAAAFEIWIKENAPVDVMRKALAAALSE